ncbi:hypothetical protein CABS01_13548 [Colletotrichum abscissum]|nr:uncharacterized protein CTAM01_06166 [Colletotrichum tamarilloi]XP_060394714.1 uncharacterized protein CABS01_13548 [Colletotrichum abscissum]KAK1485253.1 hypothetical protein CABS01_13548 [Colletotrichum abscissum]KAK1501441.1 hypothetical protein CTAM01_06166 [Colletotrichum tamarilloi]
MVVHESRETEAVETPDDRIAINAKVLSTESRVSPNSECHGSGKSEKQCCMQRPAMCFCLGYPGKQGLL